MTRNAVSRRRFLQTSAVLAGTQIASPLNASAAQRGEPAAPEAGSVKASGPSWFAITSQTPRSTSRLRRFSICSDPRS